MSVDGFVEELQNGTVLQPQRLHDRQDALHKAAARRAMAAERTTTPQDRATLGALDVVVGRFDTLDGHERPQRRVNLQQATAEPLGLAITTAQAGTQNFQKLQHQRHDLLIEADVAATTTPKQVPQIKNPLLHTQATGGDKFRLAATLQHLLPIALEVGPTDLPLQHGHLVVGTPTVTAQNPEKRRPDQLTQGG